MILPTKRPNGSWYRPRKPLRVHSLAWNDDGQVVMVYGTHDAELARDLAQAEWDRQLEAFMGEPLPEPRRIWIKVVPWDAFGFGYARTHLEVAGDTKGSWPALQYGYES